MCWLIAALLMLVAVHMFRLAGIDFMRQSLRADMAVLQTGGEIEPEAIRDSARSLPDYPFWGALADTRADALSLLSFINPQLGSGRVGAADSEEISNAFSIALAVRPKDGYLWARYGFFLENRAGPEMRGQSLAAMMQALALSPRDYNTIRLVAEVGVRRWPELGCAERQSLVAMLSEAMSIDDSMLSRWNVVHHQAPVSRHLEDLFVRYDFDLRWASINAANCHDYDDRDGHD